MGPIETWTTRTTPEVSRLLDDESPDVARHVETNALGVHEGSVPGSHEERGYTGYIPESDSVDERGKTTDEAADRTE